MKRYRPDARVAVLSCVAAAVLALPAGCASENPGAAALDGGPPGSLSDGPPLDAPTPDAPEVDAEPDVAGTDAPGPPPSCDPEGRGQWCRPGRAGLQCGAERWAAVCRNGAWWCGPHGDFSFGIPEERCGPDPVAAPTDAGPLDEGDAGVSPCSGSTTSNLPGVRLLFDPGQRCSYTKQEVARGLRLAFQLVVEADVPGLHPRPSSACRLANPENGFIVELDIAGGEQRYCFCDTGICRPYPPDLNTTGRKGVYDGVIVWYGNNWPGPSDTYSPERQPFPPGTYTVTVRAEGTRDVSAGAREGFEVVAQRSLTILP